MAATLSGALLYLHKLPSTMLRHQFMQIQEAGTERGYVAKYCLRL